MSVNLFIVKITKKIKMHSKLTLLDTIREKKSYNLTILMLHPTREK